ncbi:MAG: hypothetical protein IKC24_07165 [Oscillospiraceae bacterium]|nr:hypothetical protein [Oscillospiraceae bacterium]
MKVLQQLLFYDCDQSTQEKQKGSIPKDTPLVRVTGLEPAAAAAFAPRKPQSGSFKIARGRWFTGTQEKQKGSIPKDTPLVRVSLKDLANASRINVLQAASKALLSTTERNLR